MIRARAREDAGLLVIGAGSAVVYSVGFSAGIAEHATHALPVLYYPLFCGYAAAGWRVWRRGGNVGTIIAFAVLFRLLTVADEPALSSDLHRYPWDGRVQRSGESPYRYAPADPALNELKDGRIHPRINRPWARTVYPPGSQLVFAVLPYDIDGVRLFMIACDLLTMLLLVRLLRARGLDPSRLVLYAWAPLVVFEVGNNGHVEAAMLPLLIAAALALADGRGAHGRRSGLLLGAATAMKLYPALLLAALRPRDSWRALPWLLAPVALLYAAYGASVGPKVLGFLPEYVGSAEDHNIGLRRLLEGGLGAALPGLAHTRAIAFGLCVAGLCGGAAVIWRRDLPLEQKALALTGLYLVTLPTALHPWYALWLVPWLCFHPRASWLWLTAALPLSYLKYGSEGGEMPGWVVPLEWVPTALLLLVEARAARRAAP